MTKELLQQALDALMQVCPHSDAGVKQHNDAIVAIQDALAQPVPPALNLEPVGIVAASPGHVSVGWIGGYAPKHNDKLYVLAAIAQPVPPAGVWLAKTYRDIPEGLSEIYPDEGPCQFIAPRGDGSIEGNEVWMITLPPLPSSAAVISQPVPPADRLADASHDQQK